MQLKSILFIVTVCACFIASSAITADQTKDFVMEFTLLSDKFIDNSYMPDKYTCKGEDISPPLAWHDAPQETKSYVLMMDDPDAPNGTWVHWVLFNIPPTVTKLSEDNKVLVQAINATNSWGEIGYRGPCPPSGTHRYFFKLYALDDKLVLNPNANQKDVIQAMQNHILETAQLVGLYSKDGR